MFWDQFELTHKNQLCPFYPNSIVREVTELDIDYGGEYLQPCNLANASNQGLLFFFESWFTGMPLFSLMPALS